MLYYSCKPETDGNNILSQVQSGCHSPFIANDELASNYVDKCLSSPLLVLIHSRKIRRDEHSEGFKYSACHFA